MDEAGQARLTYLADAYRRDGWSEQDIVETVAFYARDLFGRGSPASSRGPQLEVA